MKDLLLDTQLLIWSAERPHHLPNAVRDAVTRSENRVFFSLVSIWETAIKQALNRSDFTTDAQALRSGLLSIGFTELAILPAHVLGVTKLSSVHRDPFDRLLVAQAQVEGLVLLTTDKKLAQYGSFVQRY